MSRWVSFDDVIETTADRLTRGESDQRSRIYRFDPRVTCPRCEERFEDQAERNEHLRAAHGDEAVPRNLR